MGLLPLGRFAGEAGVSPSPSGCACCLFHARDIHKAPMFQLIQSVCKAGVMVSSDSNDLSTEDVDAVKPKPRSRYLIVFT